MAVIDCITFNGEHDLFEIRYSILKDYVDQFIVCEARTTFSGKPKELTFDVKKYPDVKYFIIPENYTEDEKRLAEESPNTIGAEHWKREFLQKESIKKALTHLDNDDIVYISDCDEIYEPIIAYQPTKLRHKVYTYYLNNRSSEDFWGTLVCRYEYIKENCLNHLRSTNHYKSLIEYGWHFTSLKDGLRQKLLDSYTEESYATPEVMARLDKNIENSKDFLGRDFKYRLDESDWPAYLKQNRHKYKHLIKDYETIK